MRPTARQRDEAHIGDLGLSLIELIVGIVVSMIVLIGIATVFINSVLTQNDVLSTSEATNRGQIMSSSIERAMRNGLFFEVRESGSELWVHTTLTGEAKCQAFRIAEGVAQLKTDGASLDAAVWGTWLDASEYDRFDVNVLVPAGGAFTQTPATIGRTLDYDFSVDTDSGPVSFRGESSIRAGEEGSGGCW